LKRSPLRLRHLETVTEDFDRVADDDEGIGVDLGHDFFKLGDFALRDGNQQNLARLLRIGAAPFWQSDSPIRAASGRMLRGFLSQRRSGRIGGCGGCW